MTTKVIYEMEEFEIRTVLAAHVKRTRKLPGDVLPEDVELYKGRRDGSDEDEIFADVDFSKAEKPPVKPKAKPKRGGRR